ncbi:non-specific lipid transfer protein GPI-anchored 5-like [Andrographis paniculata]|uniref:non-specific lipid transfer protein GPI-anchored 5-like n=1 Tax=Andrographis paniculata TaxID=175694 RepID=UPI0021E8BB2F|nr:non-specific lipid transfer protein GPI-anchored 5-like [Andrographis paniculata]
MGLKAIDMGLVLMSVFMLVFWNGVAAQSGCTTALISLSPCLSYVGGNTSTPSSSCCTRLAGVVQGQPQCLCSLLNGGGASSLGFTINQTLALALPGACDVQTPPVSRCNAANGPTASSAPGAPAESPASDPDDVLPESPTTPSDSDNPSGTGSKTGPGADGVAVGGSSSGASFSAVGIFIFVVSSTLWATQGHGF